MVRLAFFTNATSSLSVGVLRALQESQQIEVAQVVFFDSLAASKKNPFAVIAKFGIRKTAAKVAELVRGKLNRLLGGSKSITTSYDFAQTNEIPHLVVCSVNSEDVVESLKRLNCDLIVCCSFSQVIRSPILNAVEHAINIHPSLLPQYRGPLPSFWVLKNGESESGVTFHLMTDRLDDGPILEQLRWPVETTCDEEILTQQLFELAASHVCKVVANFSEGNIKPRLQDESQASYYSFPSSGDR